MFKISPMCNLTNPINKKVNTKIIQNRIQSKKFDTSGMKIKDIYRDSKFHNYARVIYEDGAQMSYQCTPYGSSVEVYLGNGKVALYDANFIQNELAGSNFEDIPQIILKSIKQLKKCVELKY